MRPTRKPILCYVTDRSALVKPISPHHANSESPQQISSVQQRNALLDILLEKIRVAATAGVDWIQIREKSLEGSALVELTRRAVALAQPMGTSIFVNDRLDCALAAGAGGVHLGESSLPTEAVAAWRTASGRTAFKLGVSCHSASAVLRAESAGADYVFFGPVFATPSKELFGPPQGIARLREVCKSVSIPVLAIGGITAGNVSLCIEAGAAGIAAIRMFQESEDFSRQALDAQCRPR